MEIIIADVQRWNDNKQVMKKKKYLIQNKYLIKIRPSSLL